MAGTDRDPLATAGQRAGAVDGDGRVYVPPAGLARPAVTEKEYVDPFEISTDCGVNVPDSCRSLMAKTGLGVTSERNPISGSATVCSGQVSITRSLPVTTSSSPTSIVVRENFTSYSSTVDARRNASCVCSPCACAGGRSRVRPGR